MLSRPSSPVTEAWVGRQNRRRGGTTAAVGSSERVAKLLRERQRPPEGAHRTRRTIARPGSATSIFNPRAPWRLSQLTFARSQTRTPRRALCPAELADARVAPAPLVSWLSVASELRPRRSRARVPRASRASRSALLERGARLDFRRLQLTRDASARECARATPHARCDPPIAARRSETAPPQPPETPPARCVSLSPTRNRSDRAPYPQPRFRSFRPFPCHFSSPAPPLPEADPTLVDLPLRSIPTSSSPR